MQELPQWPDPTRFSPEGFSDDRETKFSGHVSNNRLDARIKDVGRFIVHRRVRSGGQVVWRARYPDPTRSGKRQRERSFPTKREATDWLTQQKEAIRRGEYVDPTVGKRPYAELADEWTATWVDLEPKTTAGYKSILNNHVLPRWGKVRASAIDTAAVQEWINDLSNTVHPRTVRRIYSVFRGPIKIGLQRRYLRASPCVGIRLPKVTDIGSGRRTVLTAGEVSALADAIDPRFRVLILTAAYTGLRAGEIGALRKRDIDLLHGTLNVERSLKEIGARLVLGSPKSGRSRKVKLPTFLTKELEHHLSIRDGGPDALVFVSSEGKPIRHHSFYRRYFRPSVTRKICSDCLNYSGKNANQCDACGSQEIRFVLPPEKHDLRFHDLRHTCASLLISAGVHPKAIQDHLGHRDIQTTLNVYGHLLPGAHEALGSALDGLYEKGNEAKPVKVTALP